MSEPGVYALADDGPPVRIHDYEGGDYGLEDLVELMQLGTLEPDTAAALRLPVVVSLTAEEVRALKAQADALSFDLDEQFIEMCRAIHAFAQGEGRVRHRFAADF